MKLDADKGQVVIYDPKPVKTSRRSTVKIVGQTARRSIAMDPLVWDANAKKATKPFPVVDKDKKIVTIYSGRQKLLVSFIPPEEYLSLPASAWDAGDEVRIYYKEDGKALRLMNVTKTNIFKK